jgi:tetratricopeptide (TPR) repeat protein
MFPAARNSSPAATIRARRTRRPWTRRGAADIIAPMTPGSIVGGRFAIERLAASGGMGSVYRARDLQAGGPVALKVMIGNAQAIERFQREADVLRGLSHPGIVRYVASGTTEAGGPWMAMEWLEGEDLEKRLARGCLTIPESAALGVRVAAALAAAHARGVVHRDIKPPNLFLPGGSLDDVMLLDFGVARLRDGAGLETRSGQVVGTPAYMAPEQARGQKDADARADVFSLGCVLFECLVGKPPFAAAHVMAVLAKILLEDAPRLRSIRRDVPQALDELVTRMLAKEPAERPRDADAVGEALEALLTAGGETSRRASTTMAPPSLTGREMKLVCVVLVGPPPEEVDDAATARTMNVGEVEDRLTPLVTAVSAHGGRLEPLADGSMVVVLSGTRAATDQAAQAARSALSLRAFLPDAPMALATGRALVAERWPVGEVIDRAAALVKQARAAAAEGAPERRAGLAPIRIDEITAGLLDARFDVGEGGSGLALRGEREILDTSRTLLGRPTPCVGREQELGALEEMFRACVSEPEARAVLVTGAAGVGKSRIRYELLRALKQRGEPMEVWIGRADPISAGAPFGMIAPALRRSAGILDGEPLAGRQLKLRARVARHLRGAGLTRVTEFLGELLGVPFPDDDSVQLRAARADATLMGDQMKRAWTDFVAAETAVQPLLIVLEDLHWGDLPSVKLIDAALRELSDRPLMALALGRPEVHELFPGLWAERGLQEIRLGGLKRKGSERLVRAVLGEAATDEVTAKLWERSGGNAFYLEELIRAVAEGKGDALPETVLAMVQARLTDLEPEARRLLRAASIFGQVFWRGAVEVLLGAGTGRELAALEERELISRRGEGRFPREAEYVFRHATVREAAYAMLTDGDRRLGHLLAGDWLERAGEPRAVELAEHFERGGEPKRAVGWYRRAAEQALGGNDLAGALDRAEGAVRAGAEGEALGELRVIQAEAHRWRGENAEAERRGAEAMTVLPRGGASWCAAAGVTAVAAGRLGKIDRLVAVAAALEALAMEGTVTGPSVIESSRVATHLAYHGKPELADALFAPIAAPAAALSANDPAVRGHLMHAQATMALIAGDPGGCLDGLCVAAASFEAIGDMRNACGALGNVGYAFCKVGAYAEAVRCLTEANHAAERLGLGYIAATTQQNLGPALAQLGRLDEARAIEEQAARAFHAQGDVRLEAASYIYLAHFQEQGGDLAAARAAAETALTIAASIPGVRAYALGTLARVMLAEGRPEEARPLAEEAMALVASLGGLEEGEPMVRLGHAEALLACGDEAAAREALAIARDRLLALAAKISDPARRASLLANVPEHARTLALAERLGA